MHGTAAKLGVGAPRRHCRAFRRRGEWARGLDFEIGEDRCRGRGAEPGRHGNRAARSISAISPTLGLTLPETKRLLAALQQEIVAAQVRDHAVRRPTCSRCGGGCRVKDYRSTWWPRFSARSRCGFPAFAVRRVAGASLASTGHRIAGRRRNWIGYRRISPHS